MTLTTLSTLVSAQRNLSREDEIGRTFENFAESLGLERGTLFSPHSDVNLVYTTGWQLYELGTNKCARYGSGDK
jgi:hypothetical protein